MIFFKKMREIKREGRPAHSNSIQLYRYLLACKMLHDKKGISNNKLPYPGILGINIHATKIPELVNLIYYSQQAYNKWLSKDYNKYWADFIGSTTYYNQYIDVFLKNYLNNAHRFLDNESWWRLYDRLNKSLRK